MPSARTIHGISASRRGAGVFRSATAVAIRPPHSSVVPHSRIVIATVTATNARSVRALIRSSWAPITSAAGGKIGRMYEGSLEPDRLKNASTKAHQIRQNRIHAKATGGGARQLDRSPDKKTPVHGNRPTASNGRKYHHAPVRRCS